MEQTEITKVIGIIEGVARETNNDEIGVWTDGVGLFYDNAPHAEFQLEKDKKYRIIIEEVL